MEINTPKQIEKELASIEKGAQYRWGSLSLLLDTIENTGFWHRDSDSFTSWLEKNALCFGVKPPMLWRILTAGRYTNQVRDHLASKGIIVPALEYIPKEVSPENIELLAKLERVLPADTFTDFAQRVFAGQAKRAELRSAWQTYRPALKGRTARGRGVSIPRLNLKDPDQYKSLMEATVLDALKAAGPSWSGHKKTDLYQVFLHVNPDGYRKKAPGDYLFSAVAVVKPMGGGMEYHAFTFKYCGFSFQRPKKNELPESAYCDFLWFMIPPTQSFKERHTSSQNDFPGFVGWVELKDGKVNVLKPAERSPINRELQEQLISALFTRSLKSG